MKALFPTSTQMDLLELWELSDPGAHGAVTLTALVRQLRGERPRSPVPGPSHYSPDAKCVQRAVCPWSQHTCLDHYSIEL